MVSKDVALCLVSELAGTDIVVCELVETGIVVCELAGIDIVVCELVETGIVVSELVGADIVVCELVGAGIVVSELVGAGIVVSELVGADIVVSELVETDIVVCELVELESGLIVTSTSLVEVVGVRCDRLKLLESRVWVVAEGRIPPVVGDEDVWTMSADIILCSVLVMTASDTCVVSNTSRRTVVLETAAFLKYNSAGIL